MYQPEALQEIVRFVTGCLDEEETAALSWDEDEREWQFVGGRKLTFQSGSYDHVAAIDVTNAPCLWWERIYVKRDDGGRLAAHLVHHDPAAVLTDIAAKRVLVALHGDFYEDPCGFKDGSAWGDPERAEPCLTLRHIACGYRRRPGFKETWSAVAG